jgi:hypothetical protein
MLKELRRTRKRFARSHKPSPIRFRNAGRVLTAAAKPDMEIKLVK